MLTGIPMKSVADSARELVLYDGKNVEEGTTDKVILHPQNEYTKKLIESAS